MGGGAFTRFQAVIVVIHYHRPITTSAAQLASCRPPAPAPSAAACAPTVSVGRGDGAFEGNAGAQCMRSSAAAHGDIISGGAVILQYRHPYIDIYRADHRRRDRQAPLDAQPVFQLTVPGWRNCPPAKCLPRRVEDRRIHYWVSASRMRLLVSPVNFLSP